MRRSVVSPLLLTPFSVVIDVDIDIVLCDVNTNVDVDLFIVINNETR